MEIDKEGSICYRISKHLSDHAAILLEFQGGIQENE